MRILLIEDDAVLVDMLVQSLTSQRYIVDTAEDGKIGWEYVRSTNYDLILMDVGLPKLNGIALCQQLRSEGCSTPILLITAKDASTERIRGLDAGADDYLIKPLDLGELQARVRALLRRKDVSPTPVLEVEALRLDPNSCQVTYEGKGLELTPKEYSLLELFLRNPMRVFSRANIIEHLWTLDEPPQEDSVKAHIKGLRQKLKAAGAVDWIENVYGLGYRLSPRVRDDGNPTQASTLHSCTPTQEENPALPTVATVEQQFNQARDKLWQQYRGLMAQRLEVLQQAATAVQSGTLSQELRQSAGQAAHKLAGVLGMFEREAGTVVAREIERILQTDGNLLPTQERQLLVLIQELGNSLSVTVTDVSQDRHPQLRSQQRNENLLPLLPYFHRSPALKAEREQIRPTLNMGGNQTLVKGVNVLVVDDDPVFLAAVRPMLEPCGIRMTGLDDPQRFWDVLSPTAPDLLILDVEMPQLSGIELCQAVRNHSQWQGLPILFLTAHRDLETVQQVFAAGADDYVTKPVVASELLTRITNRLERIHLLQTFFTKDPITRLANQPQSSRDLEHLLRQAEENSQPVCLVVLSAIQLRQINIQYTHAAGNQVLQRWSHLFQTAFCSGEVLGYWGNGEFVVGMAGLTKKEAIAHLCDILTTLRQQVFSAPDGSRFQALCKFALAEYPADGLTLHSLYQIASSVLDETNL